MQQKIILENYFKIKMFLNRASSHLNIPVKIFELIALVSAWLKIFDLSLLIVIPFAICLFLIYLTIGYFDYKWLIINKEISFNNQFNPELQKLLRVKK